MDNRPKHLNLASNVSSLSYIDKWINFQSEAGSQADARLQIVYCGTSSVHGFNLKGRKRKWEDIVGCRDPGHSPLTLGLQCSPDSSESSKRSSGTVCTVSSANVTDEKCSMDLNLNFKLNLEAENTFLPKAPSVTTSNALSTNPAINLQLSLSVGASASSIKSELVAPAKQLISLETSTVNCPGPTFSDGSVSSRRDLSRNLIPYNYMSGSASLLPHSRFATTKSGPVSNIDLLSIFTQLPKSPFDCTVGGLEKQKRSSRMKNCQFPGCLKGARGASRLCIAHGGGRRCQKSGCRKGAEGKTIYCKAHGGGQRCEHLGCTKSAEGRTDFCIAHGGGRRCSIDGCTRAARGKSGLCIRHGGGKRCPKENCKKSAEGRSGLCIAHGGGGRCQFPECTKGAQGRTMFCKAHGGGKRCSFPGCSKGAEGSTPFCKGHGGGKRCLFQGGGLCSKSVHGGTQFCVAHGGGKRCAAPDCAKSARGRTDFCVRHGGGKRCLLEGCGKSAQGSTNFCKGHGGGKRCSWGKAGSDMGAGGLSCDRFARGKLCLCAAHRALVQDHQVHDGKTIGILTSQKTVPAKADKMKGIVVEEQASFVDGTNLKQRKFMHPIIPVKHGVSSLTEGRVHGGSLMALLASDAIVDLSWTQAEGGSTSNQG